LRRFPGRRRGQSTIEYTLLIAVVSVPFSFAFWYFFFHPRPGATKGRLIEFLELVTDFTMW
jgi:hypothetical protein